MPAGESQRGGRKVFVVRDTPHVSSLVDHEGDLLHPRSREGRGDQALPAPPAASREQEATVGCRAERVGFVPLDHESNPTLTARSRASSRVERGPSSRSKVIWRAYPLKRIVSGADSYACRRLATAASLSSLP